MIAGNNSCTLLTSCGLLGFVLIVSKRLVQPAENKSNRARLPVISFEFMLFAIDKLEIDVEVSAKASGGWQAEIFKATDQPLPGRSTCFRVEMLVFCPKRQVTAHQRER